jgi:hypothetical protein
MRWEGAAKGDTRRPQDYDGLPGASKSYVTTDYAVYRLRLNREEIVLVTSATSGSRRASPPSPGRWSPTSIGSPTSSPAPTSAAQLPSLRRGRVPPAVKDESFASESIFGQITGRRASLILGDDLETPNTSETEGKRAQLRPHERAGRGDHQAGGDIYLLGTAQTEQTVYKEYHEEKGYELRIWPIVYPIPPTTPSWMSCGSMAPSSPPRSPRP